VRRQSNAPQQFGEDLRPIAFLQGVELLEELLGGLRHEIRVPSSGVAVKGTDFFVAKLWTTGVHEHAETGANTRVSASELFRGLASFTSWAFNEMRTLPPFVRNAKVGSSSLLPSTRIPSKRGSFGCLFLLYRVLWTVCGQVERVQRGDPPFERRMGVALKHPRG
jgi:hypothetical protein